jgi:hypothetical protein
VSAQLGRAKESEVRELLRDLSGEQVEGRLFGQDEPVQVPNFDRVSAYRSSDGQVELDALAEGEETWIVEVKWRLKRVGESELTQLVERSATFGARCWCVSQAGFTPDALAYASSNNVMLSQADDLKTLQKLTH